MAFRIFFERSQIPNLRDPETKLRMVSGGTFHGINAFRFGDGFGHPKVIVII